MKELTNEEIKEGVIKGFKSAIKNLIKERKLNNKTLIISKKGKPTEVFARDL
jgi:hypothetical protein